MRWLRTATQTLALGVVLALPLAAGASDAGRAAFEQPLIGGMACPSISDCVAVTNSGDAVTSHDVTTADPHWRTKHILFGPLASVACAGVRLCIAVGFHGDVLAAADPFGRGAHWRRQHVPNAVGVACASMSFCALIDLRPGLTVSLDPTTGLDWRTHRSARSAAGLFGLTTGVIACGAPRSCVMGTLDGSIAVVGDITARRLSAQDPEVVVGNSTYDALACTPAGDRCITGNEDGRLAVGAGHGLSSWHYRGDDLAASYEGAACPTENDCLLTDGYSAVLTSTDAFARGSRWRSRQIDPHPGNLLGTACPAVTLCLTFDDAGDILRGRDPFGHSPSWSKIAQIRR